MGRGHEGGTLTHIYNTPLHMVDQKPNGHVFQHVAVGNMKIFAHVCFPKDS